MTFTHWLRPQVLQSCPSHLGELHHVDASSSSNVWVVVQNTTGNLTARYSDTLVAFAWDGSSWTGHPYTTALTGEHLYCGGLRVFASNDVWMLVMTQTHGSLVLHWDGSAWTDIGPAPGAILTDGEFAGNSSSDFWFVRADPRGIGYLEYNHWNGSAWTSNFTFPAGTPGPNAWSTALIGSGTIPNRVGPLMVENSTGEIYMQAFRTGSGGGQKIVKITSGGAGSQVLSEAVAGSNGIGALWRESNSAIWIIANTVDLTTIEASPRIYTGINTSWSIVTNPGFYLVDPPGETFFTTSMLGIDGGTSSDWLFAGGYSLDPSGFVTWSIDRRISGTWVHYDSLTDPGLPVNAELYSVKYISSSDIYVVGFFSCTPDSKLHTIIFHWNGSAWSAIYLPVTP